MKLWQIKVSLRAIADCRWRNGHLKELAKDANAGNDIRQHLDFDKAYLGVIEKDFPGITEWYREYNENK